MAGNIDKVVLITGASSRIGEATAREMAATGARLFIGARRGERLKAMAEELGETVAVYCATKHAVRAITEGLRQEHDEVRSTLISPGVVATELGHDITDPEVAAALTGWRKKSLTPDAIARAVRYAIEQPEGVDINEVIVRPTAADM